MFETLNKFNKIWLKRLNKNQSSLQELIDQQHI